MTVSITERLPALTRLSAELRTGASARDATLAVLDAMPHILPADAYAVWRWNDRARIWEVVASTGLSPEYVETTVPERGNDESLRHGPFFIEDLRASDLPAERRAFYEREGVVAMAVLPLNIRGEAAGTIVCFFRQPRTLIDGELHLGGLVADLLAASLGARKFERFAEAARVVSAELDLQRVVQSVTDAATELTGAHFGAFFYNVVDHDGESYTLYTISGVPREAFSAFPMPRNTELFEPTFSGRGTVRSADVRKDPRYGKNPPHYGMPEGHLPVVSYLAVPVLSRSGEVLGGLFFGHPEEGVFTESEEQIAEALAAHAAVAIDNARLYDALQRERALLAQNEARYRSLVLAAPSQQAIWITDAQGRVVDDLPSFRELTGQSRGELLEHGWEQVLHPDDRQHVVAAWMRAIESREPFSEEMRLRVRDGSYRWFRGTGVPVLREDGSIAEWAGTTTDIHERKVADDNLRFLARASDLFASSLDVDSTLKTLAKLVVPDLADWCAVDLAQTDGSYERVAVEHIDPAKVELAHELRRRFPPDPETDPVGQVIRTGKSEWAAEIPPEALASANLHPDYVRLLGDLGLMSYMVVPLRARGRVLGAVTFVYSDQRRRFGMTDLSFAEEIARRAGVAIDNARLYTLAQAANRAKDEFLATLSHELRTPMTAVLGWARMLKLGLADHEVNEAIDAIERGATAQMQLIEDILDMSRIMAGKMRIETTAVDLRRVAEAAMATVRPAAAAKEIDLLAQFGEDIPPVAGDENRLQQVVWNLLTNAIKFTPRGGCVLVRIADGSNVTLSVRDTGAGIPQWFLPHVFDPFRQQDSSTTRTHGGIGVGLAIVRHLVELHGGRISAQSDGPDHGATFVVDLPAMRDTKAAPRPEPPREFAALDGARVLVIDDDDETRGVLTAILQRANADVSTASSVREALDTLQHRRPAIIICDLAMPGEDGYAFVRALRAFDTSVARVPVIALTAFGRPEDRQNAMRSGFNAYLKKPVDPSTLTATVREMMQR
jgi:PAS domain S-box-containing protein